MTEELKKLDIAALAEHMKKYKDALFLVGPGIGIALPDVPTLEEREECYNNKTLRRDPEKFWAYFRKYVFVNPDAHQPTEGMRIVKELNDAGLISTIVTQNTDGMIIPPMKEAVEGGNVIHLHGDTAFYSIGRHTLCNWVPLSNPEPVVPKSHDGKSLRPRVLLNGENYKQEDYEDFQQHLINTHTLVLVGFDYTEEPIMQLVADYIDMKNASNALAQDHETRMAVAIGVPHYNLNTEVGKFEFIVDDEPAAALARLQKALV